LDIRLVPEVPADADVVGTPAFADRPPPADAGFLAGAGFTGRPGEIAALPDGDGRTRLLVGMGPAGSLDAATLRRAAAGVARAVRRHRRVALHLPEPGLSEPGLSEPVAAAALVEGFLLGSYRFTRYKSAPEPPLPERLDIIASGEAAAALDRARRVADAVTLARDLGNEPGGALTPAAFADRAADIAARSGLTCTVWDERRIADEHLGGLLGVSRGSTQPPRLVILEHAPAEPARTVALVGKGVTFDSGGLTIKPNQAMLTMKIDMAGAAAVLAAMSVLPDLGCSSRVVGWLPLTDNMPGGDATRLGDVLRIRNGTTVEVRNADAEGRLILADALVLAAETNPDAIVDLGTLTAAIAMAVGRRHAGLAGSHPAWLDQVRTAADRAGEAVWPLPFDHVDPHELRSAVADLVNVNGKPHGQSSLAALFLQQFVPASIPWAHLDIYGPAFSDEDDGELTAGATGFGVRTLIELLCAY
jgi:leucyl aminopeptidase